MARRLPVFLAPLLLATAAVAADEPSRPHVLLTNDDGIDAPGLAALIEAVKPLFRVTVCAPMSEQSGVGHSISYRNPVRVVERSSSDGVRRCAIDAPPATCVRIGVSALLAGDPPLLVLSGINRGENAGRSTWVSGTVAGAREGALCGLPGIAFSAQEATGAKPDFAAAAVWARRVVEQLRTAGLPRPGEVVNVDIPHPATAARGIRVTRIGLAPARVEAYVERQGPHHERLFVAVFQPPKGDSAGTDVQALIDGYVAVTPLTIDQTDYRALPALAAIAWPTLPPAPVPPAP